MASRRSQRLRRRYSGLQRAVSVVFALTSVIPLLVFAYCLRRLEALDEPYYQLSLGLALFTAVMGYVMFRGLMARMSRLLRIIQQARSATAPAAAEAAAALPREPSMVPGLGHVQELDDMVQLLGTIWKPEMLPHLGRRVQVSTRDRPQPLVGTLVDVTDEGILLEQDGHRLPVGYPRIAAVEPEAAPSAGSEDIEVLEPPPPPEADERPRSGRHFRDD